MLNYRGVVPALLTVLLGCSKVEAPSSQPQAVPEAAASYSDLTAAVDETILSYMAENHLPGAAVVMVKDGKSIFLRGYGLANIEQDLAVDPETTVFRIGSISKALTLLTLTRLADDGRVGLADDVARYFDGISNPRRLERPITLADLLTHTAGLDQIGIGRQVRDFGRPLAERQAARPSITEFLRADNLRRVTPAGQYFRYDTYGATLAGAVIERVTGLPYDQAMRQEMFEPLGMIRSSVEVEPQYRDDLALGYGFVNGEYVAQPYEIYVTTPASSIDATVADMGRLLVALTGSGSNEHGRLFQPATAAAVLAPQFRPHPEFLGQTHGLRESKAGSGPAAQRVRTVGHGGGMLGFNASMTIIPEFDFGIFMVTNRNSEAGGGQVRLGRAVLATVIDSLVAESAAAALSVPNIAPLQDLSDYVGDYYFGVFCHSCSAQELARGGWPRGVHRPVKAVDGTLQVGDEQYIPRGDDVFVESEGRRMIYFGRDEEARVSFYVYSTSVDTFERIGE